LKLQADGSYVYTLDNTNVQVQHLTTNEKLTDEIFTYTVEDNDGDRSTTQITMTIHCEDDLPLITPTGVTVKEEALDAGFEQGESGSNPSSNEESASGTIAILAKDGLGKVTIGAPISMKLLS
jgi:VCBS repeat-containing protein